MTTYRNQQQATDEATITHRYAAGFICTKNQTDDPVSVGFDMYQSGDAITLIASNPSEEMGPDSEEVVATKGTQLFNLLHTLIDTVHADNPARYLIGLDRP